MIGRLKGIVDGTGDNWALIDVNGVGYMVEGSSRMLSGLPEKGEAVTLAIETYVREDQLRLFGFLNEEERSWFKLLLGVQGVGAKVALAIQGVLSPADLAGAVAAQDKAMVSRAPGVGPKVAQRIVQELKDKIPEGGFMAGGEAVAAAASASVGDAISALTNLGYSRSQAHIAVQTASRSAGEDADTQMLIKLALKELA